MYQIGPFTLQSMVCMQNVVIILFRMEQKAQYANFYIIFSSATIYKHGILSKCVE